MRNIKQQRRPSIDYPSGRGTGGVTAAGAHTPDRRLGAAPISHELSGFSGGPSTSADSGFSRALARVNRGYEKEVEKQDTEDIAWLSKNAKYLKQMGLSPRVVVEMFQLLVLHGPRNEAEKQMIDEVYEGVRRVRNRLTTLTETSLQGFIMEGPDRVEDLPFGERLLALAKEQLGGETAVPGAAPAIVAPEEAEDIISTDLKRALSRDPGLSRAAAGDLSQGAEDVQSVAEIIGCNTKVMDILGVMLSVGGFVADPMVFFGVPLGAALDLINCIRNLICGNYLFAFIDLIATIPFLGDTAKLLYAERMFAKGKAIRQVAKATGTMDEKVEEAERILNFALDQGSIGAKLTRMFVKLTERFKSALGMAESLVKFLEGKLKRAIAYFKRIMQAGGTGGESLSYTEKGAGLLLKKMPISIVKILERVLMTMPNFKTFIKELFTSKQALRGYAAKGEITHTFGGGEDEVPVGELEAAEETESEMLAGDIDAPGFVADPTGRGRVDMSRVVYDPRLRRLRPRYAYEDEETDLDDFQFGPMGVGSGTVVAEGKRKSKRKSNRAAKPSLTRALDPNVDFEDAIDEFSVASAAVASGPVPVLPIGMSTPGKHKSLPDLVPGYEFAGVGQYPYSKR